MKKCLIPLVYSCVTIIALLICGTVGAAGNGDGTGYGGIVIILAGLIFYCAIVIPTMCIVYSKYCLNKQKCRFLFTLYQSFFIGLPYFILCLISHDIHFIAYSIILFAWCEIWGLIGLIKLKRKKDA